MRNRRDIFILVGLFVALILFVAFGPARQAPVESNRPTTHSSGEGGALALYGAGAALPAGVFAALFVLNAVLRIVWKQV